MLVLLTAHQADAAEGPGDTPLMAACRYTHLDAIRVLAAEPAVDVNLVHPVCVAQLLVRCPPPPPSASPPSLLGAVVCCSVVFFHRVGA